MIRGNIRVCLGSPHPTDLQKIIWNCLLISTLLNKAFLNEALLYKNDDVLCSLCVCFKMARYNAIANIFALHSFKKYRILPTFGGE